MFHKERRSLRAGILLPPVSGFHHCLQEAAARIIYEKIAFIQFRLYISSCFKFWICGNSPNAWIRRGKIRVRFMATAHWLTSYFHPWIWSCPWLWHYTNQQIRSNSTLFQLLQKAFRVHPERIPLLDRQVSKLSIGSNQHTWAAHQVPVFFQKYYSDILYVLQ